MLSISLLFLLLSERAQFSSLESINQSQAVLFTLEEGATIQRLEVDPSGAIIEKTKRKLNLEGALFYTRTTPQGDKLVPVWQFLGADTNHFFLYDIPQRQVLKLTIEEDEMIQSKAMPLLVPRNPKSVSLADDQVVIISSLVTALGSQKDCFNSYFAILDSNWEAVRCFGVGKTFEESFMKGDIPIAFWWPQKNTGGIFYNRSHDLMLVSQEKTIGTHKTSFENPPSKGRRKIFPVGESLFLLIRNEQQLTLFKLIGDKWSQNLQLSGTWDDASIIGRHILLKSPSGLETRPIPDH